MIAPASGAPNLPGVRVPLRITYVAVLGVHGHALGHMGHGT